MPKPVSQTRAHVAVVVAASFTAYLFTQLHKIAIAELEIKHSIALTNHGSAEWRRGWNEAKENFNSHPHAFCIDCIENPR